VNAVEVADGGYGGAEVGGEFGEAAVDLHAIPCGSVAVPLIAILLR
jgi:hypothetical protein